MAVDLGTDIEKLRALRYARDWSYRALAAEIGITARTCHRLLTGATAAHDRTAYRVRQYLARQPRRRRNGSCAS